MAAIERALIQSIRQALRNDRVPGLALANSIVLREAHLENAKTATLPNIVLGLRPNQIFRAKLPGGESLFEDFFARRRARGGKDPARTAT
jgi:hypothetical protein